MKEAMKREAKKRQDQLLRFLASSSPRILAPSPHYLWRKIN